ncbi:MAG: hypothetical protein NZ772_09065 [Cyanobacteria bacterium]|nr:hypothetical protein [Cyanobacteriota bacterium]MDW8201615.1 hypothetical protein [Cyanobacteriota bacterium SKYGB_h_bin112]
MSPPLANPDLTACICIRGDVSIHPTAAIAPGVILQAEPNSRIAVAAGVCIGKGSILHAHWGALILEEGVSLGADVLIVGQGTIGAHACIGANSTLFNYSVESGQTIAANTLLGDPTRQITIDVEAVVNNDTSSPVDSAASAPAPTTHMAGVAVFEIATTEIKNTSGITGAATPSTEQSAPKEVYGKAYIKTLLDTLLPNRQAFQRASEPDPWSDSP